MTLRLDLSPVLRRWAAMPAWAQVLAVYVLSRLFAAAVLDRTGRFQPASMWTTASPGYLGMVSLWDGEWYHHIADVGYPERLPVGPDGKVRQNDWAFFPLFPFVTRWLGAVLGLSWAAAATTVALVCGALAVVVMRSLLEGVAGRDVALWGVVLFCCYPAAPVLQLAYTESAATLLLVAVLWCLQRGRYLLAVVPVLLLGLTRPIAAPLAVVIGLHLVRRLWRAWRGDAEARSPSGLARLVCLLLAAGVASAAWPLIAAWRTGRADAYTATMRAWRGGKDIELFSPWWRYAQYLLGDVTGPAVLLLVLLAFLAWVLSPAGRVVAGDLRAWCLCYVAYLLVVVDPVTSVVRYLLLLFPLGAMVAAASPSRAYRLALTAAFLAGQVVWVVYLWRFLPPVDWPP